MGCTIVRVFVVSCIGNGRGDGVAGFAAAGGAGGGGDADGFLAARLAAGGGATARGAFPGAPVGADSGASTSISSGTGNRSAPAPTMAAKTTMMYPQVRGTLASDRPPEPRDALPD